MAITAGQWDALIDCYGQHRRPHLSAVRAGHSIVVAIFWGGRHGYGTSTTETTVRLPLQVLTKTTMGRLPSQSRRSTLAPLLINVLSVSASPAYTNICFPYGFSFFCGANVFFVRLQRHTHTLSHCLRVLKKCATALIFLCAFFFTLAPKFC